MPNDVYNSLDALKRDLRAGVDYRIRYLDRAASVTIIAPHGGFVDEGTSAIARAIASRQYNLFDFQGLHAKNALNLHVTSTRFRDAVLEGMLKRSAAAVSVHGMDDREGETIWLGGLNTELKRLMQKELVGAGFTVNPTSPMYKGEHPQNIVNLVAAHGVQLELPLCLRKAMFAGGVTFVRSGRCAKTNQKFHRFVAAIRRAIAAYTRATRA